jgi:uncharacterized repeat protein (TIGR02543 family)
MLNPPYTAYESYKIANPPGGSINSTYQIGAFPTVIIINPDQSIAEQDIWPINNTILRNKVTQHGGIPSDCNVPEIYNLTLVANPEEGGELSGEGEYEAGEDVEVTATTNDGWAFISWTNALGQELSTDPVYSFTMPENDLELTANFELMSYTLSLLAAPEEGGEVVGAGIYYPGDEIEVDAIPNENWEFINWTDPDENVISVEPANIITMPEDNLTLIANFRFVTAIEEHTLGRLSVYPNPATDRIKLISDEALLNQVYEIRTQNGTIVLQGRITAKTIELQLNSLKAGVYLLITGEEEQQEVIKIMIK